MKKPNQLDPDDLLASLGRILAEDAERSPRPELEKLTRGELDARSAAELELEAERDPEVRRALLAHRPLGADAQERIARRLLEAAPADAPRFAAREPRQAAAWLHRSAWVASLALAAALLLWLWPSRVDVPALASYRAEVKVASAERAAEPGAAQSSILRVSPDQPIEILLRPSVAEPGEVEAAAFLEQREQWAPVDAALLRGSSGSVRLSLRAPDFQPPARLVVVVARPAVALSSVARESAAAGPGWQQFSFELERPAPLSE